MAEVPVPEGQLGPMNPEVHEKILEMNWLVNGWFEVEDIVLWAGDPGIGKSLIAMSMGLSLASGQTMLDFWPHPTGEPFRVAILDFENRKRVIQRRLIRLAWGLGIDLSTVYPSSLEIFPLRGKGIFGNTEAAALERRRIESFLDEFKPHLILLDTIMSSTDQEDLTPLSGVRFIRDGVMAWARRFGCGFHPLHHNKKPDEQVRRSARIGDLYQASGGGFVGMTDATILVQYDDAGNIILTNPKQRHAKQRERLYLSLDDEGPNGLLRLKLSPDPPPVGKPKHISWEPIKELFRASAREIGDIPNALLSTDIIEFLGKPPRSYSESVCSTIVNNLVKDGLLTDNGQYLSGSRGRPPRVLTITPPTPD